MAPMTWHTYAHFVRRHRRLVLACMALGLLVGIASAALQPARYSGTAWVLLSPVPSYVGLAPSQRLPQQVTVDTDAQLVRDAQVIRAVAEAVDQDPGAVAENLAVTAAPLTRVLRIAFTSATPQDASVGASAAAAELIAVRHEALGTLQAGQTSRLDLRIRALQERLDVQQKTDPLVLVESPLPRQVSDMRRLLLLLEQTQDSSAELIRDATVPTGADPANQEVPLTSGLMVGLLVGCGAGASRDRLRRPPTTTRNDNKDQPETLAGC